MGWDEVVIGFDARVGLDEVRARWDDEERRHTFLLSPEVDAPLSVDEAVWPRRGSALDRGELDIRTPRFRSWAELRLEAGEIGVALTRIQGPGEPPLVAGPADPPRVDPSWERLGWDVVSGVFPSAASNCGYPADEVLDWRARFGGVFNRWHLFDDLPTAFAFRDAADRRVAEHAPFAVLGLYRISPRAG